MTHAASGSFVQPSVFVDSNFFIGDTSEEFRGPIAVNCAMRGTRVLSPDSEIFALALAYVGYWRFKPKKAGGPIGRDGSFSLVLHTPFASVFRVDKIRK